jgi:hypothetical protein
MIGNLHRIVKRMAWMTHFRNYNVVGSRPQDYYRSMPESTMSKYAELSCHVAYVPSSHPFVETWISQRQDGQLVGDPNLRPFLPSTIESDAFSIKI